MLGGFYAAVSLGIAIIFGLLEIANISQPAFVILGSYAAYDDSNCLAWNGFGWVNVCYQSSYDYGYW